MKLSSFALCIVGVLFASSCEQQKWEDTKKFHEEHGGHGAHGEHGHSDHHDAAGSHSNGHDNEAGAEHHGDHHGDHGGDTH